MRNVFIIVLSLLIGCAAQAPVSYVDQSLFTQLKVSSTTKEQTLTILGKPAYQNVNPDGRSIYMYDISKGQILSLLYAKSGVLSKVDVFEKK